MPQVPEDYVPVFLQIVLGLGFAVFTLTMSVLIGKRGRRTAAKDTAYECGKDPIGPTHSRFSIKFYLVAMLFILFVGFLYALKKKAFDWTHNPGDVTPPVPLLDTEQTPLSVKLH